MPVKHACLYLWGTNLEKRDTSLTSKRERERERERERQHHQAWGSLKLYDFDAMGVHHQKLDNYESFNVHSTRAGVVGN